jgi:hypothetical protein
MLRAVATRWNTVAELIGRVLQLREGLQVLVSLEQHNKSARGVRLKRFKLSKQEWDLLSQLHPLLDVRVFPKVMCMSYMQAGISGGDEEDLTKQGSALARGHSDL